MWHPRQSQKNCKTRHLSIFWTYIKGKTSHGNYKWAKRTLRASGHEVGVAYWGGLLCAHSENINTLWTTRLILFVKVQQLVLNLDSISVLELFQKRGSKLLCIDSRLWNLERAVLRDTVRTKFPVAGQCISFHSRLSPQENLEVVKHAWPLFLDIIPKRLQMMLFYTVLFCFPV